MYKVWGSGRGDGMFLCKECCDRREKEEGGRFRVIDARNVM